MFRQQCNVGTTQALAGFSDSPSSPCSLLAASLQPHCSLLATSMQPPCSLGSSGLTHQKQEPLIYIVGASICPCDYVLWVTPKPSQGSRTRRSLQPPCNLLSIGTRITGCSPYNGFLLRLTVNGLFSLGTLLPSLNCFENGM